MDPETRTDNTAVDLFNKLLGTFAVWLQTLCIIVLNRQVDIVRILLESGFLWGSGDLVCEVVPEKEGYHKEVREAFARTVLHDLVRNDIHLDKDQLMLMKKSEKCGGISQQKRKWIPIFTSHHISSKDPRRSSVFGCSSSKSK